MSLKNKLLLVAVAACLAGFGVACGGSSTPAPEQAPAAEPTAGGEAAPAAPAEAAPAPEAAPAEAAPAK